jgi:hypothetical protein
MRHFNIDDTMVTFGAIVNDKGPSRPFCGDESPHSTHRALLARFFGKA